MTREEAIKWFKESPFYHKDHEPFNIAIKALEQEPVLDKIRAEILEYIDDLDIADAICEIIDKYKAENKPQESEEY